jgi:hypothetical protein
MQAVCLSIFTIGEVAGIVGVRGYPHADAWGWWAMRADGRVSRGVSTRHVFPGPSAGQRKSAPEGIRDGAKRVQARNSQRRRNSSQSPLCASMVFEGSRRGRHAARRTAPRLATIVRKAEGFGTGQKKGTGTKFRKGGENSSQSPFCALDWDTRSEIEPVPFY